jgi:hypothetical protein
MLYKVVANTAFAVTSMSFTLKMTNRPTVFVETQKESIQSGSYML